MKRSAERGLLLLAMAIGVAALALVQVARYRTAAWTPLLYGGGALAAFLVPHALLTRRSDEADPLVLPLVALLTGVGLSMLYRLDPALYARQAVWVAVGLGVMLVLLLPGSARWLASYKYLAGALSLALLAAAVLFGVEIGGTRQWIRLGQVTFQPSETVKVLLVVSFAAYLSEKRPVLQATGRQLTARYAGPLAALGGFALLLLLAQRDLGAGVLLLTVAVIMLYAATGRLRYPLAGGVLLVAGAVALRPLFPHIQERLVAWRDPWSDLAGVGYQVAQGLFALGSGGLTGTAPGLGHPEVLPAAPTDLIFAAIGEEWGLAGALALVAAYLLLVGRAARLSVRAGSWFEALLAAGLGAVLAVQTFIILGGVLRLIPLTGVTLPFVSYGGNSMISSLAIAALLLACSPSMGSAHRRGSGDAAPPSDPALRPLRPRLRALGIALLVPLVAVAAALGWWGGVRGAALAAHPANPRLLLAEEEVLRGTIYDRRLRPLAETAQRGGVLIRRYPQGALAAHLVGYRSRRFGKAGLEAAFDAQLLGVGRRTFLEEAVRRLLDRRAQGQDLLLTLDLDVQREAARALGNRRGAVVVIDPRSGAVLASVSFPSFDPNTVDRVFTRLRHAAAAPLLDRAAQGTYPPGSAFKVVTMAAGLASGTLVPTERFSCPGSIVVRGTRVTDFEERAHGSVDLREALVRSCNIAFIKAGLKVGGEILRATARTLGIGTAPRYELPAAAGHLPDSEELSGEGVGQAAFGQGSLAVSPLQMALIAAALANGGILYDPYLVAQVRDPGGRVVMAARPAGRRVLDRAVAAEVARTMIDVVERGTGRAARVRGVEVAGKTGTAETPAGDTHAWFIAFAPADAPTVALAVVVEHGGIGGRVGAPIARQVLRVALDVAGR